MQNLKITKNTNTSPTLKINIVLNVQNIKEIKGLRTSLNGVASLLIKIFIQVDFHAIHLNQNQNEGELNKNNKNKNKIKI